MARGRTIAGIGQGKMRIDQGGNLKRRGAAAQAIGRTEGAEPDSASHTAAIERAMEETPIGKRAEVTKDGVLIVTIVMGEAGAGIVMEVTDMADAVARIVAIVVMMGMIVLSAGVVATAIVIVANDRAEIDMEE
jgi:hypothetical protein